VAENDSIAVSNRLTFRDEKPSFGDSMDELAREQ